MGTKREAPKMAGFFKVTNHGEGFAGTLKSISDIGKGSKSNLVALFSPCLVFRKEGKKKVVEAWDAVTINITGDLKRKIDRERKGTDFGKHFSGVYKNDEPVPGQPSKMKIYDVDELTIAEFKELAKDADMTHRQECYPMAPKASSDDREEFDDNEATAADDGDDLPF